MTASEYGFYGAVTNSHLICLGYVQLSVQNAKLPSSNPARIDGAEQNWRLLFDAATSQSAIWQFVMPPDYGTSPILRVLFSMNATQSGTNAVIFRASIQKDTDGDVEDVNTNGFDTANTGTKTLVSNQTAGYVKSLVMSMANADSAIAGDFVQLKFDRDAANGSDTATGDAEVVGLSFEYTRA